MLYSCAGGLYLCFWSVQRLYMKPRGKACCYVVPAGEAGLWRQRRSNNHIIRHEKLCWRITLSFIYVNHYILHKRNSDRPILEYSVTLWSGSFFCKKKLTSKGSENGCGSEYFISYKENQWTDQLSVSFVLCFNLVFGFLSNELARLR